MIRKTCPDARPGASSMFKSAETWRKSPVETSRIPWRSVANCDSRKLEIPGCKRLDIDHGKPIDEMLVASSMA
jgi:hypothetical protein